MRVIACLFILLAQPAAAQTFRDWQVVQGGSGCVATVSIGLAEPQSGLATLAAFPREDGAVVTARVPVGADLSTEIAYSHPGRRDAVGLTWQSCDGATCLAAGAITAAEIDRFKAGSEIYLAFRPLPGSRPLIAPVSLMGFTRAWRALETCG